MLRRLMFAVLLSSPAIAFAQTTPAANAEAAQPPQRIRSVTLAPGQDCPKGTADEIVVCSTNDQPYRIPKPLRDTGPVPAQNQSWVNRAQTVDQVGRVAGGLPNTCSVIGSAAATGCVAQMNERWAAERRASSSETQVPR
ncbi:MAG: hypothetical protein OSB00_03110 [Sphingomonas bacterium]|nr:hypothetical protein [Sphingomonas bacterium]